MDAEAPTDTVNQTISEATFLLTELRYTLGQIHVQIGDLDAEARRSAMCGDRSVESILQDMMTSEDRYQEQYAKFLGVDTSKLHAPDQIVPLPLNEDISELPQEQDDFEHNRAQTIALLESAGDNWPDELLALVRQHVAEDRRHTTDLAECRMRYFESDTRPDLDEPLTAQDGIAREPDPSGESDRPVPISE